MYATNAYAWAYYGEGYAGTTAAPAAITPASSGVSFSGTGTTTAPAYILGSGFLPGTSIDPADLIYPDAVMNANVAFGGSGTITASGSAPVAPASTGVSFGASGSITAPTRVPFSATGVSFSGTGSLTAPTRITPSVPYSAAVLADSPDVYYRLDETGSGPFVDRVAAHNLTPNAAIVSASSLLVSDPDAAAVMDYSAAFFTATSAYTLAQEPMTVEFWVKPLSLTSSSAGASVVAASSNGDGWCAQYMNTTGAWTFVTLGVLSYNFSAVAAIGVTQHVVFVLQTSNAVDLYINGVFQQTVTSGTPIIPSTGGLRLNGISGVAFANMQLDEFAVYKSALSAARIAAHYQAGSAAASAFGGVSFGATGSITSIPRVSGSSSVTFTGTGSLTAPTSVTPASSNVTFGSSGSITAPTSITPASASVTFSGTGSITAAARLTIATSGVAFTGTGSLTAPALITPASSGVAFSGSGNITAGSIPFIFPATSGVTFAATAALTAPTQVVFSTSGVAFSATGSITAPASLTLASSGVSFSATGSLTAPTRITFAPSGVTFAATGSITAAPRIAGTGSVVFTGTGVISAGASFKGYSAASDSLSSNSTASDAPTKGATASDAPAYAATASDA